MGASSKWPTQMATAASPPPPLTTNWIFYLPLPCLPWLQRIKSSLTKNDDANGATESVCVVVEEGGKESELHWAEEKNGSSFEHR